MSDVIHPHDATWLKERVHALQDQVTRQQLGREVDRMVIWALGFVLFMHLIWERFDP